jgi:hypothetical protein
MASGERYEHHEHDPDLGDVAYVVQSLPDAQRVDCSFSSHVVPPYSAETLGDRLKSASTGDLEIPEPPPGNYSGHVPGDPIGLREYTRDVGTVEFEAVVVGGRISVRLSHHSLPPELAYRLGEVLMLLADEAT